MERERGREGDRDHRLIAVSNTHHLRFATAPCIIAIAIKNHIKCNPMLSLSAVRNKHTHLF